MPPRARAGRKRKRDKAAAGSTDAAAAGAGDGAAATAAAPAAAAASGAAADDADVGGPRGRKSLALEAAAARPVVSVVAGPQSAVPANGTAAAAGSAAATAIDVDADDAADGVDAATAAAGAPRPACDAAAVRAVRESVQNATRAQLKHELSANRAFIRSELASVAAARAALAAHTPFVPLDRTPPALYAAKTKRYTIVPIGAAAAAAAAGGGAGNRTVDVPVTRCKTIKPLPQSVSYITVRRRIWRDDEKLFRFAPYFGDEDQTDVTRVAPRKPKAAGAHKSKAKTKAKAKAATGAAGGGAGAAASSAATNGTARGGDSGSDDDAEGGASSSSSSSDSDSDESLLYEFEDTANPDVSAVDDERVLMRVCDAYGEHEHVYRLLSSELDYSVEKLHKRRAELVRDRNDERLHAVSVPLHDARLRAYGLDTLDVDSLHSAYDALFCRRCFVYDCKQHGPRQPKPSRGDRALPPDTELLAHAVQPATDPHPRYNVLHTAMPAGAAAAAAAAAAAVGSDTAAPVASAPASAAASAAASSSAANGRSGMMGCGPHCYLLSAVVRSAAVPPPRSDATAAAAAVRAASQAAARVAAEVDRSTHEPSGAGYAGVRVTPSDASVASAQAVAAATGASDGATGDGAVWDEVSAALLRKLIWMCGRDYCLISRLMGTQPPRAYTCAQVASFAVRAPNMAVHPSKLPALVRTGSGAAAGGGGGAAAADAAVAADGLPAAGGNRKGRKGKKGGGAAKKQNQTAAYLMKQQMRKAAEAAAAAGDGSHAGMPPRFVPCNHPGPCSAPESGCTCFARGMFCEKYCGCDATCRVRFPGCHCSGCRCRTRACPCYAAARECDPDLCRQCQAHLPDAMLHTLQPAAGAAAAAGTAASSSSAAAVAVPERICTNVSVQNGHRAHVLLGRSRIHGWGAFAAKPLGRGDLVTEYLGELISQDEGDRRGKIYDKVNRSYLFNLNADHCVDAARTGNKIKFANHSQQPNCYSRIVSVAGQQHVAIFAKRDIAPGEELLFDYQHDRAGAEPEWFLKTTAERDRGRERDQRATKSAGAAAAAAAAGSSTASARDALRKT